MESTSATSQKVLAQLAGINPFLSITEVIEIWIIKCAGRF
jgi:hypothetical protein